MKFGLIYDSHQQPHELLQSTSGFGDPGKDASPLLSPCAVSMDHVAFAALTPFKLFCLTLVSRSHALPCPAPSPVRPPSDPEL